MPTGWTVESETPMPGTPPTAEGGWTVESETPMRPRRGPRAPNGNPTTATRGPGSTPQNPIPYGGRAQRGQYIVAGDGTTMLRGNDGVFRRVELPGVNSGGGFNGMTRRDGWRRQAANANVQAPRPDRGFWGWRVEDAIAPGRAALDALNAVRREDQAAGAATTAAFANGTFNPMNIPRDMWGQVVRDGRSVGAMGGLVLSPVSGAFNEITAPISRGMTNIGIGNDRVNNDTLTTALSLLVPEKPNVAARAAAPGRFAPMTGARPTVAEALADPRNTPPPRPASPTAPPAPTRPQSDAQVRRAQVRLLQGEGIEPTPGQRAGPGMAGAEDKVMSVPIVGDAVGAARLRGRAQLNRAVTNRALGEIGETLPGTVRPGNDAVAYAQAKIGEAYDRAADMVTSAEVDDTFATDLAAIRKDNADLPEGAARDFERILQDRIARLSNGPVDGATLKQIQSELRGLAAKRGASGDAGERDLGEQLDRVATAIGGVIARNNPEAGNLIAQADRAWLNFSTLRRAAASPGAQGGLFSPAQLRGAVRASDKSVGKGATARGDANMYDLADAATEIMGGKVPDSGTAGRLLIASLAGTAASPLNPVVLKGMATAFAVSVPYFLTARKLAGTALQATNAAERAAALAELENMAVKSPRLRVLVDQIRGGAVPVATASVAANDAGQ